MARPLFNASIEELEAAVASRGDDAVFLASVLYELRHRTKPRALRLREELEQRLAAPAQQQPKPQQPVVPRIEPPGTPYPLPATPHVADAVVQPTNLPKSHYPPITNDAGAVLSVWTALEVLSPPRSFRRPEDLVTDSRDIAYLDQRLPWEKGERSRPGYRLYYQVLLGAVNLELATAALVERYGDSTPNPPSARGKRSILAALLVDRAGCPVDSPIAVSSFGWGVMAALRGQLTDLAQWPTAERSLVEHIEARLRILTADDEGDEKRPLTRDALFRMHEELVRSLGLPSEFVEPPAFAIRSYAWFKDPNPPEPLILNSFFLGDLALARELFTEGKAPATLCGYLAGHRSTTKLDLLEDFSALSENVSPQNTPPCRWPGNARRSLVLLQQAAVNVAVRLPEGGLLGVNGPPGTGKTTLLQDLVAAVVVERAKAMTRFADPETAFTHSGQRQKAGDSWLHLYRVDASLRGFEMLVASANNRAVENISKELPGIDAIAADAPELRYFKSVADVVHERETWGLIAAVLGNAQNRARFRQTFWWDEEVGMNRYLAAAAGTPQVIETTDPLTGTPVTRPPRVVSDERPPATKQQAALQWAEARARFARALKSADELLVQLETLRQAVADLPRLTAMVDHADRKRTAAQGDKAAAEMALGTAGSARNAAATIRARAWSSLADALTEVATDVGNQEQLAAVSVQEAQVACSKSDQVRSEAQRALAEHIDQRPGFLARMFRRRSVTSWNAQATQLRASVGSAQAASADAGHRCDSRERSLRHLSALRNALQGTLAAVTLVAQGGAPRSSDDAATQIEEMLRAAGLEDSQQHALQPLLRECRAANRADTASQEQVAELGRTLDQAERLFEVTTRERDRAKHNWTEATERLARARSRGAVIPDETFFSQDRATIHLATPWLTAESQRLRDAVFIAAVDVHRAFAAAAAKPLRHNLGTLMSSFSGQGLKTAEKRALYPDLWCSLFLVVPLVSTTFASVERMLGKLAPQSLGWLIVDEAGQATPQAAVGALLRARRAVIVGDPLQIEPVVSLPDLLTTALCRELGVDPERYAAPNASVQTLADAASSYTAEFQTRVGSRTVGMPLLVHRRCSEPMFAISNAIAYGHLMISAKEARASAIRDVLGPSAWLHVQGPAEEKWCPDEGEEVLRLLRRLAARRITPDLFIITPFVIVAERLRHVVLSSGVLTALGIEERGHQRWAKERIGTVHTVQGREAEAVVLVLGAPSSSQRGARNWAGGRPNILNVAATRAKEALYVIGNRQLWREAGVFSALDQRLPA